MIYNSTKHRWELQIEDAEELGDVISQYGSLSNFERQLKLQSMVVYNYIYSCIPRENKDFIEYLLAKDPSFKEGMQEALMAQLMYDLASGGNDVVNQIGIDFKTGGSGVPRSRQIQSQVSPLVRQILENINSDFNIFYLGDYRVRMEDDRYEKRGY